MKTTSDTKIRILEKSIEAFNRFGFVNIRLQHIADEVGISVGNLAYHFNNKDTILEAIYEELEQNQKILLSDLKIVPLFINIDKHIRDTFEIQQKFSFFYSDTFEILRSFPLIKKQYREYTRWYIAQIENMINFNVARGTFLPESQERLHSKLAEQYWMTMELWLYQSRIRIFDEINVEDYVFSMWALLIPHFTHLGNQEFKQMHFQENFNWL
jgi:AcrR family transcriptional regulator